LPPVLLDIGNGDPDDLPTVQRVTALRSTLIGLSLYTFCKFFYDGQKQTVCKQPPYCNIVIMENMS